MLLHTQAGRKPCRDPDSNVSGEVGEGPIPFGAHTAYPRCSPQSSQARVIASTQPASAGGTGFSPVATASTVHQDTMAWVGVPALAGP